VVTACGVAAAQSAYQRDAAKHRQEREAGETHIFKKDLAVRKYGSSKAQLERDAKNPKGKHFTTSPAGRPPTHAQAKVGLAKKPKYMLTGRAQHLNVDGKGHDKAVGGKRNVPDLQLARNNHAQIRDAKIGALVKKAAKQKN
jgi:hypothetical protein